MVSGCCNSLRLFRFVNWAGICRADVSIVLGLFLCFMDDILEQMRVHFRVMAGCDPISDAAMIAYFRECNLEAWATHAIRTRDDMRFATVEPIVRIARQLREWHEWDMMLRPAQHHVIPPEDSFSEPMPIARLVGEQL